jgi:hypothetical protein
MSASGRIQPLDAADFYTGSLHAELNDCVRSSAGSTGLAAKLPSGQPLRRAFDMNFAVYLH